MFVPFDHLYHWILDLIPEPGTLYSFSPPGQKDITNLTLTKPCSGLDLHLNPEIICHDQEPLNFFMYENLTPDKIKSLPMLEGLSRINPATLNLRAALIQSSIYDKVLLIHSEKNSQDLESYLKNGYLGVHYWAHAVIAKDWYRFAKIDGRFKFYKRNYNKLFLIYNRGWSGTREYRIKFSELLYQNNLLQYSSTGLFQDSEHNLNNYQFNNLSMRPTSFDFVKHLPANTVAASSSADYVPEDFNSTALSVVLETVFDDSKIHLTEKTLRPIACGHPFILAAGPGSLKYLKSYGFKTFAPWIDESYDIEPDSLTRMKKIQKTMQDFANQPASVQSQIMIELDAIAKFNKEWFFSEQFDQLIRNELIHNLTQAFREVNRTTGKYFLTRAVKRTTGKYFLTRNIESINLMKRSKKLKKLKLLRQQLSTPKNTDSIE